MSRDGEVLFEGLSAFFSPRYLASIGSTNAEAKRLAVEGAPEGTLVVAGEQTAGRGRGANLWSSPPGNLYCSLILRPPVDPATAAQLSFVAAVAVYETVSAFLPGRRLALKWPNDVLVDGAKICGILLESAPGQSGRLSWVILGIGVNVAVAPKGGERRATSLVGSGARDADVETCLKYLANELEGWYGRWRDAGFAPIREAWLARCGHRDAPITVRLPQETFEGRFVDLGEGGALIVELDEGARREVAAGEVFFAAREGEAKCC